MIEELFVRLNKRIGFISENIRFLQRKSESLTDMERGQLQQLEDELAVRKVEWSLYRSNSAKKG